MSWRRASTTLAMLAALMMAPSSASAAKPNELTAPAVQPTSGNTATTFVLSVRYRSGAGNPASAVTATVAGQTLPMAMTTGTAVDGVWTVSTKLPVGSWAVTYSAEVAKGPTPTVGGVTVTVVGNQPSPSGPVSTPSSGASEPDVPVATPLPNPVQSASPRPVAGAPSRAAKPSTPASNASPGAAPASSGGSGGGGGNSSGGRDAQPLASAAGAPAPSGRQGLPGGVSAGTYDPMNQGLLDAVLLFGIVGVAAVALVGVGWIVVTGRRHEPEGSLAEARTAADPAITAIPTVEQRAMRRARLNQSNDPILAALGLADTEPPRAARQSEGRLPRSGKRAKR